MKNTSCIKAFMFISVWLSSKNKAMLKKIWAKMIIQRTQLNETKLNNKWIQKN